jgi:hypothetical protein
MPLIESDSDEALKKNIKTEIKAGREPKQAVAIALDIQRRAKAKKKKSKNSFLADPKEKLKEIDFRAIEKALLNTKPEDSGDGTRIRYVAIGRIQDLAPSGKYYIVWATDHKNPEIDADVEYWNGFEEELEKFSFSAWLENDGDQIKVGAHMEEDQNFEICPECNKPEKECVCETEYAEGLSVGDMVKWNSAGGMAQGKIKKIIRNGDVPGIPVKVTGTEADPAAQIEVYREGEPSGVMTGHKLDSLSRFDFKKTGQSTPAPPKDRIKGSDKNKPQSAKDASGDIELDESTVNGLENKASEHNEKMKKMNKPEWSKTTVGQLKAVYRRGAGAYSTSHRPGVTRAQWANARVNAYLYLLENGKPKDSKYVTDNDLLPDKHPRSTR